jgi:hypothetical protein
MPVWNSGEDGSSPSSFLYNVTHAELPLAFKD